MGITSLLVVALLGSTVVLGQLPDCFDPTACDGNLGSCTIGFDCLGSIITMCGAGNLTANGACQTFADGTPYCECNSAVGIVNEVIYKLLEGCSCIPQVPGEMECEAGQTLVECSGLGKTQYVCTTEVDTTFISGC